LPFAIYLTKLTKKPINKLLLAFKSWQDWLACKDGDRRGSYSVESLLFSKIFSMERKLENEEKREICVGGK
jgi:hypothetical protein